MVPIFQLDGNKAQLHGKLRRETRRHRQTANDNSGELH